MSEENKVTLCGASSYEKKFYLNPQFSRLPEAIRNELQIMCVLFTEDVGGILTLVYDEEGSLSFEVKVASDDYMFDEIGCELKIKEIQRTKAELLESLEMFYRVVVLGEDV